MTDPLTAAALVGKAADVAFPMAMRAFFQRQFVKSQEILRRHLERGDVWAITDDRSAYAIWQYFRAASAGAATRNLELLAEAIVSAHHDPTLTTERFRRHSDALAGMTREEVIALGSFIRHRRAHEAASEPKEGSVWNLVEEEVQQGGSFFQSLELLRAHCGPLTRTGYIQPVSTYGGIGYTPTILIDEVARLVDLDAAAETAEAGLAGL